jgi:hypothetical protein
MNPLRRIWSALTGRRASDYQTEARRPVYPPASAQVDPLGDFIRSDSTAYPYVGPLDLDNYGAETEEMRLQYLKFRCTEPAARAALEGFAYSLADLDVAVIPEDDDNELDKRAANFLDWTVQQTPHGWEGLVYKIVTPALLMGYSVTETTLCGTKHRDWGGYWGLRHGKSKDTTRLRLQIDAVNRDVLGVVNTVRGLAAFPPDKVILFTHADLFENPHGSAELRSALRACQLIDKAYKLWHFALSVYNGPYLKATTNSKDRRKQLEAALADARQSGFIVAAEGDVVEVINLASAANFDAFERKIDKLREEIWLTVRGAYLPFMASTGGGGETRGSAETAKTSGSDPKERFVAKALGRVLTQQLSARITRFNFGERCGVPKVVLGGVDWAETQAQLEVAATLREKFNLPVSKAWLYKISQMPPPKDAEDTPTPPTAPASPLLNLPGLGGAPVETFRGR